MLFVVLKACYSVRRMSNESMMNLPSASTMNNMCVDNLNDGSKEFNKMMQRSSNVPPALARRMYETGLLKHLQKNNLIDKVRQVQTNPILQQAMKQDYLKFASQVHQYLRDQPPAQTITQSQLSLK